MRPFVAWRRQSKASSRARADNVQKPANFALRFSSLCTCTIVIQRRFQKELVKFHWSGTVRHPGGARSRLNSAAIAGQRALLGQQIVNGVMLGSVYAMVAVALTLSFDMGRS